MKLRGISQKVSILFDCVPKLTSVTGLTKGNPRLFWKEHEHEYPVLAKIARDILSIPASGAGVERLFNCARDVCHYRRGQLKPDTIKDLMLHLFSSKFDLEQSELEMIKEYLSIGEAAMLDQTRKPVPSLDELEPISDNEEEGCQAEDTSEDDTDESDNDAEEELSATQATTQTKQARRKRPRSKTSEAPDDADDGLPLPEMPNKERTPARPGRMRKKPRLPDGFEIDQP
jgi:hAT family C-terminal dimerisation region